MEKQKKNLIKKITPTRLSNIALYYLKRFETTKAKLRDVLRRRVDAYAYYDKAFDKTEAYGWIDDLVEKYAQLRYVDDVRFAEFKIRDYLAAGKSYRYILGKMKEKGVSEDIVADLFAREEYNPYEAALKLAKKKKIGPYEPDAQKRKERRNKDLAVLLRAGFDYDIALKVLDAEF